MVSKSGQPWLSRSILTLGLMSSVRSLGCCCSIWQLSHYGYFIHNCFNFMIISLKKYSNEVYNAIICIFSWSQYKTSEVALHQNAIIHASESLSSFIRKPSPMHQSRYQNSQTFSVGPNLFLFISLYSIIGKHVKALMGKYSPTPGTRGWHWC